MVGKRAITFNDQQKQNNRRAKSDLESGNYQDANGSSSGQNGDARPRPDASARPRPDVWRFRDAAMTALEDKRREELKKTLLEGVDREALEKFRKSDDELKAIKKKPVRKFYEAQNQRLNDWLEVDAIVMAIADDVLESMQPDPGGHIQSW